MPFMQRQQVQPHFIMDIIQSQHFWHISQQPASPLVQVKQQPSAVISHLHMHMFMLQHIVIMPFIIMQQESIAPPIELQRFCIIDLDIASGQEHIIFIPSLHFSILIVQRGTIIIFMGWDIGGVIVLPMPIIVQSIGIVIMFVILLPSRKLAE